MATQNSVWIVLNTDGASDRLRYLVDSGNFAEAKDIDYNIRSIAEKVQKLIQEKGGSLKISTYDRQVLEVPASVAEEFPLILSGYKNHLGTLVAAGIGLSLREAAIAAKKSAISGDIELFDPGDPSFSEMSVTKTEDVQLDAELWEPNLFDRTHPRAPEPEAKRKDRAQSGQKYVPGLNAEQSMQAEASMVQAMIQQLNGPAEQMQQQQQQQMQQQMQQQQPNDLLEALNGGPIPGREAQPAQQPQQQAQPEVQPQEQESQGKEADVDQQPNDENIDRLGSMLNAVHDKIPQLMSLADSNPDAFKKVVGVVNKLLDLARASKKQVSKSELDDITEELNKAIKMKYPVGTTKGRRRKVIVNGRAVWRSVAAGQIKDAQGQPVSVKSSNAKADDGSEGIRSE